MNVRVPGEGDLSGFFVVLAGMLVLFVAMLTYFRRRGWLRAESRVTAVVLTPPSLTGPRSSVCPQ
jgi:hypothetical protein